MIDPWLLGLAGIVGAANWAMRTLPIRLGGRDAAPGGLAGRILSATGPAALAALLAATVIPEVTGASAAPLPLGLGVAATLAVFAATRSVALGTFAGAAAYALGFAAVAL
jgi:branched-subunit amino acid transport protein